MKRNLKEGNMSFIDSIKSCFCVEEIPKEPIYRAVLFGDSAAYIENVCTVLGYTSNEIRLSLKKGGLVITGEDLYIKKYCVGDFVVCGKIISLQRI